MNRTIANHIKNQITWERFIFTIFNNYFPHTQNIENIFFGNGTFKHSLNRMTGKLKNLTIWEYLIHFAKTRCKNMNGQSLFA